MSEAPESLRLRLPATSANLGPGFDAAAVALDFYLEIDASAADEFSIDATGRDTDRCSRLDDNLILGIYTDILERSGREVTPLAISLMERIEHGATTMPRVRKEPLETAAARSWGSCHAEAIRRTQARTRQLAKRQRTWFRSFKNATWIGA